MKKENNQTRLLKYLLKNRSITSLEAFKYLGNTRLSATVFELRNKGFNIESEVIEVKNRYKEKTSVCKYYICKKEISKIVKYLK